MRSRYRNEQGYVYFVTPADGIRIYSAEGELRRVKIGWAKWPEQRLLAHQTSSPVPLKLLGMVPGTMRDECEWHHRFRSCQVEADKEWFDLTPELDAAIVAASKAEEWAWQLRMAA